MHEPRITARIEALERSTRRLRWWCALATGACVVLVLSSLRSPRAEVLRAQRFELVDAEGLVRGAFFSEEEDACLELARADLRSFVRLATGTVVDPTDLSIGGSVGFGGEGTSRSEPVAAPAAEGAPRGERVAASALLLRRVLDDGEQVLVVLGADEQGGSCKLEAGMDGGEALLHVDRLAGGRGLLHLNDGGGSVATRLAAAGDGAGIVLGRDDAEVAGLAWRREKGFSLFLGLQDEEEDETGVARIELESEGPSFTLRDAEGKLVLRQP